MGLNMLLDIIILDYNALCPIQTKSFSRWLLLPKTQTTRLLGKLVHLEQPLIPIPLPVTPQAVRDTYKVLYDAQNEVACFMLGGYAMPKELGVSLILNNKDYDQFVQNYNMHNMGKSIVELHAMLKLHEKGISKKAKTPDVLAIREGKIQLGKKPKRAKGKDKGKNNLAYAPKPKIPLPPKREHLTKDSACHHFKEGLRESRKLKHGALSLYMRIGMRAAVESLRGFDLILPSGLIIILDNFHFAPSITRGFVLISCLLTPPYTPQHNEVSKRRNQTLLDMVRSMTNLTTLPKSFWGYDLEIPQAPDRYGFYVDVEEYELGDLDKPLNYKAALLDLKFDKWLKAMNTEMQLMKDNQVWVLVKLPPNGRTVRSQCFSKKKTNMDGYGIDTLNLVSKYLNGIEDILDDGDSLEARKLTVEKSKEYLELFEALDHKSVIVNKGSHRIVVFKKAPPRAYSRPFTRFPLPCDVDGQGAWDAELDITKERHDQLGFVRVDYGKYGIKMVKESRVDFRIGEMRIDLTMLEEMKDIDVMLDALEEVGSFNGNLVKMGKASRNKNHKVNKLTPQSQIKIEEIPLISAIAPPSPIYHPLTQKQKDKVKKCWINFNKVLMGRARLNSDDYGEEIKMRIVEHGLPKKMYDPGNFVLPVKVNGTIEMNALADTGASTWGTLCIDDGVIRHTYFPKPRAKAYLDNFAQEEEDDWLSCFEVRRDKDGNPKYGHVTPSFLDIEDDMEIGLAMEAYFNPFKNIIVFKKLINFLGLLHVQLKNMD
uniref:Zinc finger, CCHC-type n=1 Tax=Tanacetum cinerariifolium TaxID=118510 RepID=A0A6L2MNE5_TANCI|nr:zinc finger, CCHC-type [Tanacetum cinerariifolium]